MVSLVATVLALLLGGGVGGLVGRRATGDLAAAGRQRIARSTTVVLGGLAGALLGSSLVLLVRQLDDNASIDRSFGVPGFETKLDALTVAEAFTHILFYGGVLVALATIVALLGKRAARAQRP